MGCLCLPIFTKVPTIARTIFRKNRSAEMWNTNLSSRSSQWASITLQLLVMVWVLLFEKDEKSSKSKRNLAASFIFSTCSGYGQYHAKSCIKGFLAFKIWYSYERAVASNRAWASSATGTNF